MLENIYFSLGDKHVYLFPFEEKELNSQEYLRWMNTIDNVKTIGRNDYLLPVPHEKLVEYVSSLDKNKTVFFAIYYSDTTSTKLDKTLMTFVGTLKLYDIDFVSKKAAIGIMVGNTDLRNKGIGTEAIRLVSDYCFNVLSLHKVYAGYYESNIAVKRAFEKNGFIQEGVLKDHFYDLTNFINVVLVAKIRA